MPEMGIEKISRRDFLKFAGAAAAYLFFSKSVGAESQETVREFQCPIYYFHQIPSKNWFESNLYNLISQDYYPVAIRDVNNYFSKGEMNWPANKKPFVLTFDDGFLSQYQNAIPILSKWQIGATFFVMPDWKGDNDPSHIYMTNDHFVELSPNWEIASHTFHHPNLRNERLRNHANWQAEIKESKERLEEIIRGEVISFAYPFGSYDLPTLEFTAKHYKIAVTTGGGSVLKSTQRFNLPRLSG